MILIRNLDIRMMTQDMTNRTSFSMSTLLLRGSSSLPLQMLSSNPCFEEYGKFSSIYKPNLESLYHEDLKHIELNFMNFQQTISKI